MDTQLLQVLGLGVGVVVLIGGIALFQTLRANGKAAARQALADRRGWRIELPPPEHLLWQLRGRDEGWTADAARPRPGAGAGTRNPHNTRFSGGATLDGGRLHLIPRTDSAAAGALMRQLVQLHGVRVPKDPVLSMGPSFDDVFEVRASDRAVAERVLNADMQSRLLGLANTYAGSGPLLALSGDTVLLVLGTDLHRADAIATFIDTGLALESAAGC